MTKPINLKNYINHMPFLLGLYGGRGLQGESRLMKSRLNFPLIFRMNLVRTNHE
jgi:hypothetical protein